VKLAELLKLLEPELVKRIDRGDYDDVAQLLEDREDHLHAAVLWETTWNYERACGAFIEGGALLGALRCALSSSNSSLADDVIRRVSSSASPSDRTAAEAILRQRRRSGLLASLLSGPDADPSARSDALADTGDIVGAAEALADVGRYDEALHRLRPIDEARSPLKHLELAASLHWKLGDAEQAAKLSQHALRKGASITLNTQVLAPALAALGHGLAADIVRRRTPQVEATTLGEATPQRGRYLVQGVAPHPFAGRALLAVDRIEHREVEIHDLLSDSNLAGRESAETAAVVRGFIETALAAAELKHPALRPILWGDVNAGLLILERGSKTTLRSLIRPPGLLQDQLRVRAMMLFMLRGLAAAHDRGLVHGAILPSLIVFDPAERPLLSPFGLHRLSGIVATRTGSLDELLTLTAPEVKAGRPPTPASDIFSLGQILAALSLGHISVEASALPQELGRLVTWMTAAAPEDRPTARQVLAELTTARDTPPPQLAGRSPSTPDDIGETTSRLPDNGPPPSLAHVVAEAHSSWHDDELEMLCSESHGFMQPIIDRQGRRLLLAAWPTGCSVVDTPSRGDEASSSALLEAIERLPQALAVALRSRMSDASVVVTPGGSRMLGLDALLRQAPSPTATDTSA